MGRNTKWTDDLKREMFDFFTEAEKNGNQSVLKIAEEFSKLHEDITPSQVKSAYYKFSDMQKKTELHTDAWSETEDIELLNAVENRNGTLTAVFEDFARTHRRPTNNVSQHYYYLLRHGKNEMLKQKFEKPEKVEKTNKQSNTNITKNSEDNKSNPQIIRVKRGHAEIDMKSLIKNIKKMPKETIASISHIVESINNQM
jgi:hypothetical protein